ncbi:MAG: MarR family EPS-associated transcriptional regulator [Syntrophorhabdales bacterium]|jgi:EPS-associated MarR family transcriptional regulator
MNETEFKTLRELSEEGSISQRELSKKVGLSLGGVNYIIKELMKKGYIVAQRFKNSNNKTGYIYALTPQGINAHIKNTQIFLEQKLEEYEKLRLEIEELRRENENHGKESTPQ